MNEKPIVLTSDLTAPAKHPSPLPPSHTSHSSPRDQSQELHRGLSRATSVVTAHVLDLCPIAEEQYSQHEGEATDAPQTNSRQNPFLFPTNGFIRDDGGSPPISMVAPSSSGADIVVTDVEDENVREDKSFATQKKVY